MLKENCGKLDVFCIQPNMNYIFLKLFLIKNPKLNYGQTQKTHLTHDYIVEKKVFILFWGLWVGFVMMMS